MECDEFISSYSSYRDGLLDPEREELFRDHLAGCESCARYDRVVRKGTEVLRDLPRPEPSPDFLARLRHRIYHVRDGIPLTADRGGGPAVVAVAAVGLLAFAWLPFATQMSVEVELPAVAVEEPPRSALTDGAEGEPAASDADRTPRFLEPGVLVGADRRGGVPGLYDGVFWPRPGEGMSPGIPGRGAGPSFLATSGPSSPAPGR